MKKRRSTSAFKHLFLLALIFNIGWHSPIDAQCYIWGVSKNYHCFRNDSAYCYIYKSESIYKPTQIYYEMCKKVSLVEEISILNVDYNNTPISFGVLNIAIDGQDTSVSIDTSGFVCFRLPQTTHNIAITTFTKPQGFHVPISDEYIPSKIKIVWGVVNDGPTILTICSKIPLSDSEITEISNLLFLGAQIDSESYYYYFSDE